MCRTRVKGGGWEEAACIYNPGRGRRFLKRVRQLLLLLPLRIRPLSSQRAMVGVSAAAEESHGREGMKRITRKTQARPYRSGRPRVCASPNPQP